MRKFLPYVTILFALSILYGCDKERIVTTTDTIYETEYVDLPPDTVLVSDTFYLTDTNNTHSTDTLFVNSTDTVFQTNTITIVDTVIQTNTIIDTVEKIQTIYDTVTVTETETVIVTIVDTVVQTNFSPDINHAYTALQYYTDPEVLNYIYAEFGIADGWILYLSSYQNGIANPSTGVFDLAGYIDYWVPDWSSYYPLEYSWRVTYTGGDPAIPTNWQLTDPPSAVNGMNGGITLTNERSQSNLK